jgi:hypothetical protein
MPASLSVALEEERQNAVVTVTRLADVVPVNLTLSGNEITDAARTAALAWPITQQGGQTDALAPPAGVGIYRAATNLFRRGQADAVSAEVSGKQGGEVVTSDATVPAPFSPRSFKCVCDASVASQGGMSKSATGQAAAAGTMLAGSVWFKGTAGQGYASYCRWQNTDATSTIGTILTFTASGAWQLLTPPPVAVAAGKTGDQGFVAAYVNGTRAETFWFAHAMMEKGQSLVAPYVATSGGATATHNPGRVRGDASLVDETQFWIAVRVRLRDVTSGAKYVWGFRDDNNNQIWVRWNPTLTRWEIARVGAGTTGTAVKAATPVAGDFATVVAYGTASQIGISVNGAPFASSPQAVPPVLAATTFDIGGLSGSGTESDTSVRWFACGKGTLTDDDAAALYALGNTAPDIHATPGNPTLVWPGVTQSANTLPPAAPWPDGTTVTLERRSSQSGNVAGVRGWIERDVSGTTVAMARDWEVPFDVDLVYTATLSDGTVATGTFRIDYHACEAWLVDLARPTNSLPLVIESMSTLDYALPVGVHRVLDRRAPILTTLPAWTPSTELLVLTETLSERDRVRALYGSGYPFLLRTDPEQGVGNIYFGLTDFKEERIITLGRAPLRRFLAECVQVERPDPALFTPSPPNTYADVLAEFDDYADLLGQMETYDAMLYHIPGETTASPVTPWLPDDV